MERIIGIGLRIVLALIALAAGFGLFVSVRGAYLGFPVLIIYGMRVLALSFVGLVVVAALTSVRKRLAAIEAKLTE